MNRESLRLISACLSVCVSTGFAAAYNAANRMNASYYTNALPLPTQIFADLLLPSLAFPFVFAGVSFYVYRKRRDELVCQGLAHGGHLFSFAWALLAIWAWYLPHVAIGELAK